MRRLLCIAALVAGAAGCSGHPATTEECNAILDRIVELELHELGFRDPALEARKAAELRSALAPELRRCEGVRVRATAIECARHAKSAEEISHKCLR
jgi:hypothetical protein